MKTIVLSFLLSVAWGITSCRKAAEVDPMAHPLKNYTLDVQQAKQWLPGRWTLIQLSSMIPNPTIPNVELIIDENQIVLLQNGIQTDKVDYTIVKNTLGLRLDTNAQPRKDNWYIRNPSLYINPNRMYLDLGIAQDLPSYEFSRVK